jgi:hypothetical protein
MQQTFAIPRESSAVATLGKAVFDYRCKDYNAPPFYQNQKISLKSIDDIFQMQVHTIVWPGGINAESQLHGILINS